MQTEPAPPSNLAQSSPRLLIVEPNRNALAVMAQRLGEAGYRVIACDNAANAPAELLRAPVDLVVAELRMEPVSGIELTRLIRDDTALRDTPVILITGKSDSAGAVDGFGSGADDVVAKPFHFEVLIARIARRIARARSVKELQADNANLDARVVTRSIELKEMRAALEQSEAERIRLEQLVSRA
jgi:DNA-binding response OmpR family regulator